MAAGSGSCLIPLSQQTRGGKQAEASAEGHFSFSSFCLPFLFGRLNISGAKQDGERRLLGGTALMSPRLNPGWTAMGSLIELAFFVSERDCWVWSLFSLYHKNEWLFLPLSLNKGGPFGFHNSDHPSPSWNGHLGSRAQRLPPSPQRGPVPGLGAMSAPHPHCSLCQCQCVVLFMGP